MTNTELLNQLEAVQQELDPQFKALRAATAALRTAVKLAREEKAEALAMQKASVKLQKAADMLDDELMHSATRAFATQTEAALNELAFAFARDLKAAFEAQGVTVTGNPPTLVVDSLVLNIDMAVRKAQWLYGKEPLTRPIPLSINGILKTYSQQHKLIIERAIDTADFLAELHQTWQELLNKRAKAPAGYRINLIETLSQITLNRQSARFWNAPSRSTFKDYPRPLFVRDLVLVRQTPTLTINDKTYRLHLGTATKNQAGVASRSIWIPRTALDGDYYGDITFKAVES